MAQREGRKELAYLLVADGRRRPAKREASVTQSSMAARKELALGGQSWIGKGKEKKRGGSRPPPAHMLLLRPMVTG